MGPKFFQTVMGRTFYDGTMRVIARSANSIAIELKRHNDREDEVREHSRLADYGAYVDMNLEQMAHGWIPVSFEEFKASAEGIEEGSDDVNVCANGSG